MNRVRLASLVFAIGSAAVIILVCASVWVAEHPLVAQGNIVTTGCRGCATAPPGTFVTKDGGTIDLTNAVINSSARAAP
jgi:hypothetical protein